MLYLIENISAEMRRQAVLEYYLQRDDH